MNRNLLVTIIILSGLATAGFFTYFTISSPKTVKPISFAIPTDSSSKVAAPKKITSTKTATSVTTTTTRATSKPASSSTTKTSAPATTPQTTAPQTTTTPPATTTTPPATTTTPPASTTTQSGQADLIIQSIVVSANPSVSNPNTEIAVTIKNSGTAAVSASTPILVSIESDAGFFTEISYTGGLGIGKTDTIKYKPFTDPEEIYDSGEIGIYGSVNLDESIIESNYDNDYLEKMVTFAE